MKIGGIEVGRVFLAPMAGVSDLAFRIIAREYGADMAVSEMVSAKALSFNDKKTFSLLNFEGEPSPRTAQLFGSSPEVLAEGGARVSAFADIIDLNMGCPAPKITGNGEGSALMKKPELVGEIVRSVCRASKVPVTVKIRAGYDKENINAVEIAKICEAGGAAAVTVHGRYAAQQYSGFADLDIIRRVKESVSIPVIGNGDIASPLSAQNMFDKTGCDGIMIGRGALGNPFVFREIKAFLDNGEIIPPASVEEKINTALRHIKLLVQLKGEHIGILEARKHVSWYVKGIPGAAGIKNAANCAKTLDEMQNLLFNVLTKNS